jgi:hypothetical protein
MIARIINTGMRFSEMECNALQSLRTKYQPEQHVFTALELAHLRFQRWLVRSPGWNRAMDQPDKTHERRSAAQQRSTWMLGFTG